MTQFLVQQKNRSRRFSVSKFLTHESIAEGVFNTDFCSAGSGMVGWQAELINTPEILRHLCERLGNDFINTPVKFRKPWNSQQVVSLNHLAAI